MTRLGMLLAELLAGREAVEVSHREMERLCRDLADLQPPRYARAHRGRDGRYVMQMIGEPVAAERATA